MRINCPNLYISDNIRYIDHTSQESAGPRPLPTAMTMTRQRVVNNNGNNNYVAVSEFPFLATPTNSTPLLAVDAAIAKSHTLLPQPEAIPFQ